MQVGFESSQLDDMETNVRARSKFPPAVVKAYRKRVWQIRAAHDERDLRVSRGANFEKYRAKDGQYSIRLNDQYRLIVRFEEHSEEKTVVVVDITDYH